MKIRTKVRAGRGPRFTNSGIIAMGSGTQINLDLPPPPGDP
jgi:hypothetical protein